MGRMKRGWALTKKSWAVLTEHRQLVRFPLIGGVATILMSIIVVGPGLYLIDEGEVAPGAPLVVLGLYVLALVGTYFSVGLAACADLIFRGRDATFADGIAVASGRFGKIAGWALVSTVIGTITAVLQEQGGIAGAIFGRLLQLGWSLITFLAVPVIAIEGTGPIETLKRSAGLFRQRWGEQITGNVAIGGIVFLIGLIPAGLLIAAGVLLMATSDVGGGILIALGVIIAAIAILIQSALAGIFGVALYRYALEGETVGGFSAGELESAVRPKGGPGAGGGAPTTI
ncbi:MAG TPA: DUF6159 family protein [Solirubrobacterales bacterium]|nr:DUF6159 family protein [Solirubrobacterales bacterium]